ncbi:MAG: sulfate ABC transporter substrate-binding protein [Gammaproteobacteria bacterium]|nr:sulfate ABC transporter substrate-binding protein [Gammaproteobacteria bacterium]
MSFHQSTGLRFLAVTLTVLPGLALAGQTLLNVSYSPTRGLYRQIDTKFEAYWKQRTGDEVTIKTSFGGSGGQSRAVINGLKADVVTLALASDIDAIHDRAGLLPDDWQSRLPHDSAPYTSTIVFLVRKGNPKHLEDWDDLVKPGVSVITPNPKTSGGARWNFLAAYAYALKHNDNDPAEADAFVKALYENVPILDTSARRATTTFTRRGIGDVLLAWENEAFLAIKEDGADKFDIVVPSISILAQPPVAVVDKNARTDGVEKVAEAYLRYLYTLEAQEIIAENFYRPIDPRVAAKHAKEFPQVNLVNIRAFGGWSKAQAKYFGAGGVFDRIYRPR